MSDKIRAALEAAKDAMTVPPTEPGRFAFILQQIDDALKEPVPDTYTTNQVQQMIREAHQAGFREGATQTSQIIAHAEPYEITTDAGVKYSAKDKIQPEASVKITRRLADDTEISQLIKADLSRGVEEIILASEDIRKRNAGIQGMR